MSSGMLGAFAFSWLSEGLVVPAAVRDEEEVGRVVDISRYSIRPVLVTSIRRSLVAGWRQAGGARAGDFAGFRRPVHARPVTEGLRRPLAAVD
jgi:hypothetical protein